ncbi:hypothetical protein [Deinococcus aquatilis]|uniref:hypothetical protein n=1 Tax=Deinococcus aquatilis TaxID=519440 RepID=UPI00036FA6EF|nr:hypothetical protein [Deinococcus aquatilis]
MITRPFDGTADLLTVQQLKERGWTPGFIRKLLIQPDDVVTEVVGTGRNGRAVIRQVERYLRQRVMEAEASLPFMQQRGRLSARQTAAAKSVRTRQRNQERQLAQFESVPLPALRPNPRHEVLSSTDLRQRHSGDYFYWRSQYDHLLKGVPEVARLRADRQAYERYWEAVRALYGWPRTEVATGPLQRKRH